MGIGPEIGQRYLVPNRLFTEEVTGVCGWLSGRAVGQRHFLVFWPSFL